VNLLLVCSCWSLATGPSQNSAFERSLELTAEGRYAAALSSAADPALDPVARAQARFWSFYNAGLLNLARSEVRVGLQAAPEDAWLLARATKLSLTLHDPASAERHLQAWQQAVEQESPERQALREQVEVAARVDRRRSAGLQLARTVSFTLLAACIAAFGWLLRTPR
jgi:hypothetical protein